MILPRIHKLEKHMIFAVLHLASFVDYGDLITIFSKAMRILIFTHDFIYKECLVAFSI